MNRSEFLTAAGAMSVLPIMGLKAETVSDTAETNQFIELIHYQLHVGPRQRLVADFYKEVAIPALNRLGLKTVGVFTMVYGPNSPSLYVIIPHKSLETVYSDNENLFNDKTFLSEGEKFINAPIGNSPFVKMEKSILRTFNNLPQIAIPENLIKNDSRIYEIRTYESNSLLAAKRKIRMFNEGGEIEIFKKTGLQPVMFAETIAGHQMPNLQYMLVFENMAARDKNWDIFHNDPDWEKLKSDPFYTDTVSCITDVILKPAPFSQI
jgi:hypothetical protein